MSVAQKARDLDAHENVPRKWVKKFAADPGRAYPGYGQMKPEQPAIEHLRREVAKLKAERDILKNGPAYFAGKRYEVHFHRKAPCDLAGGMALRSAGCCSFQDPCLA